MRAVLLPIAATTEARLSGSPLVVMLDVDGTLAPIAPRPDAAVVPPETRKLIAVLASLDHVHVALVSGRAAQDARRMVGVANVWAIGNHGYQMTGPDGEEDVVAPELENFKRAVAQAARKLETRVSTVPGVIFEDKMWTLSIHYRLAPRDIVPRLRTAVNDTAAQLGLRVTEGKEVLEVRPPARVDKGTAVLTLGTRLGGFAPGASLIYVGDDTTDEDAFRAIRHRSAEAVTVRVWRAEDDGAAQTAAEFTVQSTDDVRRFLEWLLQTRRPARTSTSPNARRA